MYLDGSDSLLMAVAMTSLAWRSKGPTKASTSSSETNLRNCHSQVLSLQLHLSYIFISLSPILYVIVKKDQAIVHKHFYYLRFNGISGYVLRTIFLLNLT